MSDARSALPGDLIQVLTDAGLLNRFEALSPSHQREYLKWIEESRHDETRRRRLAATVDRLASS